MKKPALLETGTTLLIAMLTAASCTADDQPRPASANSESRAECMVNADTYERNRSLSFNDFDQVGSTSGSFRQLDKAGCYGSAVAVLNDYLIHAAIARKEGETRILLFHLGQVLAQSGRESEASVAIMASLEPEKPADDDLDWNSYVRGSYAFLTKNKDELSKEYENLKARSDRGDQINAGALHGFLQCFSDPYLVAYEAACRK